MITISDTFHNESVSFQAFTQFKKYLTLLLKDFYIPYLSVLHEISL